MSAKTKVVEDVLGVLSLPSTLLLVQLMVLTTQGNIAIAPKIVPP